MMYLGALQFASKLENLLSEMIDGTTGIVSIIYQFVVLFLQPGLLVNYFQILGLQVLQSFGLVFLSLPDASAQVLQR